MPLLILLLLLVLSGCGGSSSSPSSPSAAATPVPPPPPPKAVVMSIDGLRGDAIAKVDVPNIAGLAARGSYSYTAQTVSPSNTLPNHVSMLSGYTPSVHKITWDDYLPSRGKLLVPTVFTLARAAAKRSVMVVGKQKFDTFQDTGFVDVYVVTLRGDDDVANQAVVQVGVGFDLMFVHFPDVDLAGHAKGWMSADYLAKIKVADAAVGRVLATLPPETTVILSADHGGHDMMHGSTAATDTTIPWIIAGPNVKAGAVLTSKVSTMDTAATVVKLLGLNAPGDAQGVVVAEAFRN
jgi:predicted AlkP superfamily pyrophosphatase or phosphodiesterase